MVVRAIPEGESSVLARPVVSFGREICGGLASALRREWIVTNGLGGYAATDKILGCAVLAIEGGELMSTLQMAIAGELSFTRGRDMIFAHPTLAEGLNTLSDGDRSRVSPPFRHRAVRAVRP